MTDARSASGEPKRTELAGRSIGYIPGLDGVRALAVTAVLLYHAGEKWASGGFLGVDVFFVLSGYLISTLLVSEFDRTGGIRLGRFWSRRARRLVPGLLAMLVLVGCYAAFLAPPDTLSTIRGDALATILYVANWHLVTQGQGYFAALSAPSPLTHAWSLAIEEQFYLLWPIVVFVVLRFARSIRLLTAICIAGALSSALAMAVLFHGGSGANRAYYGTDARAQDLLIGAVLALLLRGAFHGSRGVHARIRPGASLLTARGAPAGWLLSLVGIGCLGVIGWAAVTTSGTSAWLYHGGFAALSLATAAVIACIVLVPAGPLSRLLSFPPIVYVGRISYGIYLWHYPLFLILSSSRTGQSGLALLAERLAVTLAVAVLSFHLIEQPIRRGGLIRRWRSWVVPPLGIGATVAVVLASTVSTVVAEPVPQGAVVPKVPASQLPRGTVPVVSAFSAGAGGPIRVLLVGDSMAVGLGFGIGPGADRFGTDVEQDGVIGCGIVTQGLVANRGIISPEGGGIRSSRYVQCSTWPERWKNDVDRFHPDVSLLLVGPYEVRDRFLHGRWLHIGQPELDNLETAALERAVAVLSSTGARVVFLTDPYFQQPEQPDGQPWPSDDPKRVDVFNHLLSTVAAGHPSTVSIVGLGAFLSPQGHYQVTVDGVDARDSDGLHLTLAGAQLIQPWLLPKLAAIGNLERSRPQTLGSVAAKH